MRTIHQPAQNFTSREMRNFVTLTRAEQAQAIRGLARAGMSDYGIAAATQLSVEMIRNILGQHRTADECAT